MDVFRVESQRVDARERLASLRRLARAARDVEALRELVIEAGVLEAAIADARHDARDAHDAVDEAWRAVTLAAGRAFVGALARGAGEGAAVLRALASVDEAALPGTVEERPPEGYAHYGLFPEAYAAAAAQLVAALRPARAVVVGVRSIGTSLSAVAAAALEASGVACRSYTVRPRGHAFDRTLALDGALAAALAADPDALAVVCDEGPG